MAKESHIKTDKNPISAGVLGSYQSTTIVSAIQPVTNQIQFNISPAFSKFLFFGFSITAKAKSPIKATPIAIPIIICLSIAQFSPYLEIYRT